MIRLRVLRRSPGEWVVISEQRAVSGGGMWSRYEPITLCPTWGDAMFFAACHLVGPTRANMEFPTR